MNQISARRKCGSDIRSEVDAAGLSRALLALLILLLCAALALASNAFAWGRTFGAFGGYGEQGFAGRGYPGGGYPGRGYQGGGYQGGGYPGGGYPGGGMAPGGGAGQMFIYPNRGQSPQQEQSDKAQCSNWAAQQTGFDSSSLQNPGPPAAGAPQGGMLRGAGGGAAMGAIGGAIAGNAGEGTAIGAAAGGVFGGMRRRRWDQQEQFQQDSYMQQRQDSANQARASFNQAFAVCMTGRGYTVGG